MKPIILNSSMVNAVQNKTKTQTRRPIKGSVRSKSDGNKRRIFTTDNEMAEANEYLQEKQRSPLKQIDTKYRVGDIIYVRETWMLYNYMGTYNGKAPKERPADLSIGFKADGLDEKNLFTWRPSIHMPKWAARIFLKVTKVRVERIQDISLQDIEAEGVDFDLIRTLLKPVRTKQGHWISGNGYDQTEDFCRECAAKIVAETNKKFSNADCVIDGGWENHDSDYTARCKTCDHLLNFYPTECLIENEIAGFEQSDCSPGMCDEDRYLFDVMCCSISDYSEELQGRLLRLCFQYFWNSIYPGSWDRNDWVEVTDFERTEKP